MLLVCRFKQFFWVSLVTGNQHTHNHNPNPNPSYQLILSDSDNQYHKHEEAWTYVKFKLWIFMQTVLTYFNVLF